MNKIIIKIIVITLFSRGKTVALTCTTGLSCLQYDPLRAETVHHWTGIQDGRFTNEQIVKKIQSNEWFSAARDRILKDDVLIIDEISMLSEKLLDQIECIYRHIRDQNKIFGGIQRIGVGDFRQLVPIPYPCSYPIPIRRARKLLF